MVAPLEWYQNDRPMDAISDFDKIFLTAEKTDKSCGYNTDE